MKQTIKLMVMNLIILFGASFLAQAQDNVFNGTADSNWDNAANWSMASVPPNTISQKLTIAADCVVSSSNTTSYVFEEGSSLIINDGIQFINNGSGQWTMRGTTVNEGTSVKSESNVEGVYTGDGLVNGDLIVEGSVEPYYSPEQCNCGEPIVFGGQEYQTVSIGGQCWMAENLNIGSMIAISNNQADNNTVEKYCYDNNESNCDLYGGLYVWAEMMQYVRVEGTQGVCPSGWHLPADSDFKDLEGFLGMTSSEREKTGFRGTNDGSKLASDKTLWDDGALKNDNEFDASGFDALPAGIADVNKNYIGIEGRAFLWSSTESGTTSAWSRFIYSSSSKLGRTYNKKDYSVSVRCLRD